MASTVDALTFDCADPRRTGEFWAAVLRYRFVDIDEEGAEIADPKEVERVSALGATVLRYVEEGGSFWTVMFDPEGNEFCVLRGPEDGWTPDG